MSASTQVNSFKLFHQTSIVGWLHRVTSALILLMGIGHVAATPAMLQNQTWARTLDGLYFGGAGLAVVFIAQMNLLLAFGSLTGRWARLSLHAANLVYLGFVAALLSVELSPPIIVATCLALLTTISAFIATREQA
ncbi:hypothetical protein VB618_13940 [Microvirga sp. CF3062]|uniref:hypothetical protein n=1 Tax=Microvirga sp. CF3062 TaxID=3110182 RepID=UPI002E791CC7|nr:hypothetical protein [Microvirga sp. CF3062]MEE1657306.1 hypothetical protein [Microvirga sp. CF3062]